MTPGSQQFDLAQAAQKIIGYTAKENYKSCEPLFRSQEEYNAFCARHAKDMVPQADNPSVEEVYIGIDAGSTTVKAVVIDQDENIVCSRICRIPAILCR